jgi:hypothetical protein
VKTGQFWVTFRAEPDEVMAFTNVVGMTLTDDTDWSELAELLIDSYCVQAPARLTRLVSRPT